MYLDLLSAMADIERHTKLPSEPASAREARRFVEGALRSFGVETGDVETAKLLTSELVTNAVLYTAGTIDLEVLRGPESVRVLVADESPIEPEVRRSSVDSVSGRGLGLVELLAASWGVDRPDDEGKVVWFELATA